MDTKLDVFLSQMSGIQEWNSFTHDELRIYFSFIFLGLVIVVTHSHNSRINHAIMKEN
jgi:hypothetical protein